MRQYTVDALTAEPFSGWEAVPVGLYIVLATSPCLFISAVARLWRRSWCLCQLV